MNVKKIVNVIKRTFIKNLAYVDTDWYIRSYTRYLKSIGIIFLGQKKKVKYIDPSVYFDGWDYSKISIGDNVTISRETLLLTHDYSITTAMAKLGKIIGRHEGELRFLKPISIGNDSFIGARVTLLPGTAIGNNCIIGAGAVVKGKISDGSIVVGNPAKVIGTTKDFAERHLQLKDFEIEV